LVSLSGKESPEEEGTRDRKKRYISAPVRCKVESKRTEALSDGTLASKGVGGEENDSAQVAVPRGEPRGRHHLDFGRKGGEGGVNSPKIKAVRSKIKKKWGKVIPDRGWKRGGGKKKEPPSSGERHRRASANPTKREGQ